MTSRRYPRRHRWSTHLLLSAATCGMWPVWVAWNHGRFWWNRVTDVR